MMIRPSGSDYRPGRVGFFGARRFRTSVGVMSARAGLGCSFAMCVESWFTGTCTPQERQSALPGGI